MPYWNFLKCLIFYATFDGESTSSHTSCIIIFVRYLPMSSIKRGDMPKKNLLLSSLYHFQMYFAARFHKYVSVYSISYIAITKPYKTVNKRMKRTLSFLHLILVS